MYSAKGFIPRSAFLFAVSLLFGFAEETQGQAPIVSRPRPPGALSGKTVFLSPGHGFYYHSTLGWTTQRGNTNNLVEDLLNSELACQYLLAYLENAGADVWTCRDRSFSTVEVIVDNGDPGYTESGNWRDTSSGGYQGDGRYTSAALQETATAVFTPHIPQSGHLPLYVRFNAGTNRSDSVLILVEHAGGSTPVRITQRRDGYTWRYVGTFYWFAGDRQSVVVSNRSSPVNVGRVVVADAIRIGGGVGSEPPNAGGATSGRRRADECSVYWARYQGAPPFVYNPSASGDGSDDVTCRPLYAEFESEEGEHAVFLSVHSNGGGGSGTETYTYLDGTPEGSRELRDLVHEEVVTDLRATWDAEWPDRGKKSANFGELRLLSTLPGILVEIAFHDNPQDAAAEREPRWRRIVSRALYQGVAKYFRGSGVTLLPEPPRRLVARVSSGAAALTWSPPPTGPATGGAGTATGYRVYRSPNGFAFDNGTPVTAARLTIPELPRGSLTFFRVTATNAGGESFPTATVAARVPLDDGAPRVLIVDGFDRLDAGLNLKVEESAVLGWVDRQLLDRRLNSYDYVVEHAQSLAAMPLDLSIDSADNEVVAAGTVPLGDYALVDWFVGREGVADDTLDPAERARLEEYLAAGGALLLSGMEIGTDLERHSSAAAQSFFATWLKAGLATEDAGVYEVRAATDAFTTQATFLLGDGNVGIYNVDRPDVYTPRGAARAALVYGTSGGAAAVQFGGLYRLIHLAFPLGGIALRGARDLLATRAVEYLLQPSDTPPRAVVETDPAEAIVTLTDGIAGITLDGSSSDDGNGGRQLLSYRWEKVSGPGGDRIQDPVGWERGRAGFGYGDGDDATVLADMEGRYLSLHVLRDFHVPAATEPDRISLRVVFDDGFAAFLNGVEIARENLPPTAAHDDPAESAGEPREALVDLTGFRPLVHVGRNRLALEVHNASLSSSDLSLDAELVAETASRVERWIPSGSSWFFHRGREAPPASWKEPEFEPTPKITPVFFQQAGTYRYRLEVSDGHALDEAEVAVEVLPGSDASFRRGDANDSGTVDLSDAVYVLRWLFENAPPPRCTDAADANDSAEVDISDPIALLLWLFAGAPAPPPPGPFHCGLDPTSDILPDCRSVCL